MQLGDHGTVLDSSRHPSAWHLGLLVWLVLYIAWCLPSLRCSFACSQARPGQEGGGQAQARCAGPVPGPDSAAEFRDRELHCCRQGVVWNVVSPSTLPLLLIVWL